MATIIKIKRGNKQTIPSNQNQGEMIYSLDSKELFIGNGPGNPITKLQSKITESTSDPTSVENIAQGYAIGSYWINTSSKSVFVQVGDGSWKIISNDYKLAATSSDSNPGYLIDKVDGVTIVVENDKLKVKDDVFQDKLPDGVNGQILSSNGSTPTWINQNTLDVDKVDGKDVDDSKADSSSLWTASKIISYISNKINGLDWQESVITKISEEPASPNTGDRYLIETGATGALAGYDNNVAVYNGTGWDFIAISEGAALWVEDLNKSFVFNGSEWVTFSSVYDHNSLANLQGGQNGEFYHLTNAEHTGLTSGGNTDLHRHSNATASADGYMSKEDKTKLDTLSNNATMVEESTTNGNILINGTETNVYTHPAEHPWSMINKTGSKLKDIADVYNYTSADEGKLFQVTAEGTIGITDVLDGGILS